MPKMEIKIDSLASAITTMLSNYNKDVSRIVDNVINDTAKEIKDTLSHHPNVNRSNIRHPHYKDSFYVKKGKGVATVANRQGQLGHLLEYGHAMNGGRSRAKAFPHWRDGQEIAEQLPERIKRGIENGT